MTEHSPQEESRNLFEEAALPQEALLQDPTDFTDVVEKQKRSRTLRTVLTVVAVAAALAAVVFLALRYAGPGGSRTPTLEPTPSTSASTPGGEQSPTAIQGERPLLEAFPSAPAVEAGEVSVALEGTTLKTSGGFQLSLGDAAVTPATHPCLATQPTDFCLAARGTSGPTVFDVYFLKDAAHSRLFEAPAAFKKLEVEGSPSAGMLPLTVGEHERDTVVVVAEDSSGWMLVFSKGTPQEAEAVAASLTVSKG